TYRRRGEKAVNRRQFLPRAGVRRRTMQSATRALRRDEERATRPGSGRSGTGTAWRALRPIPPGAGCAFGPGRDGSAAMGSGEQRVAQRVVGVVPPRAAMDAALGAPRRLIGAAIVLQPGHPQPAQPVPVDELLPRQKLLHRERIALAGLL